MTSMSQTSAFEMKVGLRVENMAHILFPGSEVIWSRYESFAPKRSSTQQVVGIRNRLCLSFEEFSDKTAEVWAGGVAIGAKNPQQKVLKCIIKTDENSLIGWLSLVCKYIGKEAPDEA